MLRLFELSPTRSDRVKWTLKELDKPFESISGRDVFTHPELRKIHPLSKLPAVEIDGKGLFESAAICTYLADQHPKRGLISPSGTWLRALHDQWVCFALTEMENWLWSSFRNTVLLPEAERVSAILDQNAAAYRAGAKAMDAALGRADYLVGDKFSVTDIIVGFTCQFGATLSLNDGFRNIDAYLARLKARPNCVIGATA